MAAGLALFALLITVFTKLFPIIAVWEVAEDRESADAPAGVVPDAVRESRRVAEGVGE
jgi:hypothetical protein